MGEVKKYKQTLKSTDTGARTAHLFLRCLFPSINLQKIDIIKVTS